VLPLPLVTGLGSELGLVETSASSVPEAVAVAVPVAVPDGDGDPEGDGEVVSVGPPLARTGGGNRLAEEVGAAELFVAGLLELAEGDGEGDGDEEGDGEGDRDADGDGDGEGVGVAEAGSAWHTESVLAAAGAREAACALPSMPRVRKLPLSTVTAAALTCPKRIKDRLSTLLVRVTVCSS
jgi:hypothetical protein